MMYKPYIPPEPQPPEPSDKMIIVSRVICYEQAKQYYWPGNPHFDELEEEEKEDEGVSEFPSLGKCISIKKIQEKLPPNINLSDVYFTARFNEEWLVIEARYDEKVKLYDEQMKNYKKCHQIWLENKPYYDQQLAYYEKRLKEELNSLQSANK